MRYPFLDFYLDKSKKIIGKYELTYLWKGIDIHLEPAQEINIKGQNFPFV